MSRQLNKDFPAHKLNAFEKKTKKRTIEKKGSY